MTISEKVEEYGKEGRNVKRMLQCLEECNEHVTARVEIGIKSSSRKHFENNGVKEPLNTLKGQKKNKTRLDTRKQTTPWKVENDE